MNRLLFCEPWPVSNFSARTLDQFLDGIIPIYFRFSCSLQILSRSDHFLSLLPFAAGFFAAAGLARGLAAAFAAGAFLAGAFFFAAFGASSSPSAGAATTFSRFGRGPMVGLLS